MPEQDKPTVSMSPERRARLIELSTMQREWAASPRRRAAAAAAFDPEAHPKPGSDYNQHNIDLDADDDEFHRRARKIFGIPDPG